MTFNRGFPEISGSLDSQPIRENFEHLFDSVNTHASSSANPHSVTLDQACEEGAITDQPITVTSSGSVLKALRVQNNLQVGGNIRGENLVLNQDQSDDDVVITFRNALGDETLKFYKGAGDRYFHFSSELMVDLEFFVNGNIRINYNHDDAHAILYFGLPGADRRELRWDRTNNRFQFNDGLFVNGSGTFASDIKADGDIHINNDETDADAVLHFKTSSSVDETLRYDKTNYDFLFSTDVVAPGFYATGGTIAINHDFSDENAQLAFGTSTLYDSRYLRWNNATERFEFESRLFVNGDITGDNLKAERHVYIDSDWEQSGGNGGATAILYFQQTSKYLRINDLANIFEFSHPIRIFGNDLYLGDGTTDDNKVIYSNNGDANKPNLRYNESTNKWQYSNDGTTWSDIGSGGVGTKYILLPVEGATLPDDSTGNKMASIERKKSSAGAPSPHFMQALYDDSIEEFLYWSFRMPGDYGSGLTAKIQYKMANALASSGSVDFDIALMAVSPGDSQDVDADSMSTVNSVSGSVPGTVGYLAELSAALTNTDSLVAGDFVIIYLKRDADDAVNDTAVGDAEVVAFSLEYTPS